MPSSPNNSSFIPKRGPVRRRDAPKRKKQFFIFSIITYSILFGSLLATGGVFFYGQYVNAQRLEVVTAFNTEMDDSFSVQDFQRVQEFDIGLRRANDRISHHASIVSILDAVDNAIIVPVQIESLSIVRQGDENFLVEGSLLTSSFDAAIQQQEILVVRKPLLTDIIISDVNITEGQTIATQTSTAAAQRAAEVTFSLTMTVPLSEVLYDPAAALMQSPPGTPASTQPEDQTLSSDDSNPVPDEPEAGSAVTEETTI
jgi:hypothetical protein